MDDFEPLDWTPAPRFGAMKPYVCEYRGPNGRMFGITLYGTDPDQIVEDNCAELPELKVLGTLECTAPATRKKR